MMDAYYRQVPSTRLPVQAAIFLAAPHQGMNIEALRTVVKGEPPQALVEELTPGSQVLNDLNNRFMTVAKEVEFLTVFEGMRSPKAQQVARGVWTRSGPEISIVDEQSMKQYWASEIKICANRDDHFSIAKLRKQSQNKVVLAVMKSLRRAVFPAGGISRVNTLRTIDETTQITRTNTLKSIDETDSSGTIGSPGPQWQPTLNSALSWQNRPPSAPVSVPGSFDLESRAPTFVHSRADRSERVGLGVCSACNTDISSHEYFYQCTDCKSEYTCRKCQNSPVCHLHGKPSSKQQFVWYGDRQDVNIWIDPKPVSWDTPFVRAVKQEDLERLSALGREPEALNALDSDGLSPLHIAAHLNLENSARWLIAHGANQQVQTRKGRTPLSQAVYSNHIGMIKLLMAGGVNLKPERTSPLHRACQIGSREIVEVLLKGVDSVDIKDSEGRTALWTSCKSREFDLAELLLEAGADPNTKMKDDAATLLGSVAADNNMEAVRLLLNHNADPENLDSQQRSALFRAAEMGNDEACRALLEKGAKTQTQAKDTEGTQTILGRVASMGKLSTVRLLLESGDDIEGLDGQKRTPFARAAVAGHLLVCNYLLSMGANADPQAGYPHQSPSGNSWRWPLLHAVTVKGNAAIVQLLLENKVDLEENDTHRWTPLMTAAYGGNLELCKLFVKSGANVNHHESLISNVLTKAAHGGHLEVVKFLLASGASAKPTNGKWKNLDFHPGVAPEVKAAILQELRAKKKAQP
ncbi:ankyrin repeat-containing domain protein [Xylariaceae sp. FL1019]|nr:ankyrin repeat-containing domain protein [Xylariaceae sp. FL1019]